LIRVKGSWVRFTFARFGLLAAIDVITLLFSIEYREILGRLHGVLENIWRFILDGLMMIFYGFLSAQLGEKACVRSRLIVWHRVLGILFGIVLCIPFGGFFLAPFTPVGLLYLGAMSWTPMGYFGSLVVAITFVAFNMYLVWVGLRGGKRDTAVS
jgi:hypothetical protein